MNNKLKSVQYIPGDLVYFNGIALFYQAITTVADLEDKCLGMVLKKIDFHDKPLDKNDCQSIVDCEEVIQEPMFVYTVLCKGSVVEVLDIDIRHFY